MYAIRSYYVKRKEQKKLYKAIRGIDPESYFIIDDVHSVEGPAPAFQGIKAWQQFSKRK